MPMITIKKELMNNIPVLNVFQTEQNGRALPTVVYYHGYNGEKESSLTIAYKIAEKGLRVILPDSHLHGERQENISSSEMDLAFWDIVVKNIAELDDIKTYLEEKELVLPDRIGIGGTSMGGITTYGALTTYDWIKSAAVLMGTPKMTTYAHMLIDEFNRSHTRQISENEKEEAIEKLTKLDLSLQPELLNNRALLIWHGKEDKVVPFQHSESFYQQEKNEYDNKEYIQFLHEKGRGHHISKLSIAQTSKWFSKHL